MAKAGCHEVSLGFESGCKQILANLNKIFAPREVRRIAGIFHDYGIRQTGFLLLVGPGETRASVQESLLFADSLNLEALKITIGIRIYPYTALARTAVEEGIISGADDLLFPKFYLVPHLRDWLVDTIRREMRERPHWIP